MISVFCRHPQGDVVFEAGRSQLPFAAVVPELFGVFDFAGERADPFGGVVAGGQIEDERGGSVFAEVVLEVFRLVRERDVEVDRVLLPTCPRTLVVSSGETLRTTDVSGCM